MHDARYLTEPELEQLVEAGWLAGKDTIDIAAGLERCGFSVGEPAVANALARVRDREVRQRSAHAA